ncbi:hypothetical protein JCM19037_1286 [Geomicrobium sp. JCM 19037]|uniref:DUF6020 family protein n=1 Tax=Geomicrobium sp. JCM 19037 TaxID=1460634 RepID=UPI00045F3B86|nr:DUF6020 family protein [Geomicrobium sp. JCM 19037]GAK03009.1 hypothetical protein JCM19037_1286 [Geomicrobium sp. JCM 19037]
MKRLLIYVALAVVLGLVSGRAVLTLFEPVYATWESQPSRVVIFSFVFVVLYLLFFHHLYHEGRRFLTDALRPLHVIVIAVMTFLFYFSTAGEMAHLDVGGSVGVWPVALIAIATYIVLVWTILFTIINTDWRVGWQREQPSRLVILWFAIPVVVMGLVYWLGFFPGPMTPDSFHHWRQSLDYDFSNWHPMIYTTLTIILTSFWDNPAVVTLFQVFVLAAVYGYAMYSLRRIGLPYVPLIIATLGFILLPAAGIYVVTFWKDVLYSVFLMLFTVFFMNIVMSKGKWLGSWRSVAILTLTMLLLAFFRNNGLPIAVVSLIVLGVFYFQYWRRIVTPIVITVATYMIITGPVFDAMDVNAAQTIESLSIPHQQIGYILTNDGDLTDEQLEYLDSLMPIEEWQEAYHPFLSDHIKFNPQLDREQLADEIPLYIQNWSGVVARNFGLAVDGYLLQTSVVWQIHEPERAYTAAYASDVLDNPHGLEMNPVSERLHTELMSYLEYTEEYTLELLWRPALFALLLILITAAGVIKNGMTALVVSAPVLLNWATMLAAIPAQDFRYLLGNYFILFVVALFSLGNYRRE